MSAHEAKKTLSNAIIRSELIEFSRVLTRLVITGAGISGDIRAASAPAAEARAEGEFLTRTTTEYERFLSALWVIATYAPGGALHPDRPVLYVADNRQSPQIASYRNPKQISL